MSKPLDAVLDNASEGEGIICALNRVSVQVIFFALSLLNNKRVWLEDMYDTLSDAEWIQTRDITEDVEREVITVFDYEALMQYPTEVTMWHDEATSIYGGVIQTYHDATQNYGMVAYMDSPDVGDRFAHTVVLRAGEYTFGVLGWTQPSYGRISWSLDTIEITASQEWYSASPVLNVYQYNTLTIPEDGTYTLLGTLVGKHASSQGYYIGLTKYWLRRIP